MDNDKLQTWAKGFIWEGKKTLPADIILNERSSKHTKIKIILQEGRNRQIRKIAEYFGHPVLTLHRQAIGSLQVSSLPLGKHRFLTKEEIDRLKKSAGEEEKTSFKPNRKARRKYIQT